MILSQKRINARRKVGDGGHRLSQRISVVSDLNQYAVISDMLIVTPLLYCNVPVPQTIPEMPS